MKKKILLLFLILTLACCALTATTALAETDAAGETHQSEQLPTSDTEKNTLPAHDHNKPMPRTENETSGSSKVFAAVCGKGQVTVDADAAMLSFRIRVFNENQTEGKKQIAEKKNQLFEAMRKITPTSGEAFTYETCRPVGEYETDVFEFTANITAKIKDVSKTQEAKNAAVATGATHLYTNYLLENDKDAMNNALSLAIQDAEQKAAAILGNTPQLKSICEEHCGWHCPAEEEGKVTVHANVRAKFSL